MMKELYIDSFTLNPPLIYDNKLEQKICDYFNTEIESILVYIQTAEITFNNKEGGFSIIDIKDKKLHLSKLYFDEYRDTKLKEMIVVNKLFKVSLSRFYHTS